MQERLLDYLFGHLDEQERREVEAVLQNDAELRAELERLRRCLEASRTDASHEPPRDLVKRTCEYVAGVTEDPWPAETPAKQLEPAAQLTAETSWSTTDLAVAAGVVFATAMFFMPALQESRYLARRTQCQANLLNLAVPLNLYAQLHNNVIPAYAYRDNRYPNNRSRPVGRIYGGDLPYILVNEAVIDPRVAVSCVVCPDSLLADELRRRGSMIQIPGRQEHLGPRQHSLPDLHRRMGGSLAYRIGYLGPQGYRPCRLDRSPRSPLISDAPGTAGPYLQSNNHGGIGMNVLFADCHVDFISGCPSLACGDKLFLNNENRHAPGVDPNDAVLVGGNETIEVGSGE